MTESFVSSKWNPNQWWGVNYWLSIFWRKIFRAYSLINEDSLIKRFRAKTMITRKLIRYRKWVTSLINMRYSVLLTSTCFTLRFWRQPGSTKARCDRFCGISSVSMSSKRMEVEQFWWGWSWNYPVCHFQSDILPKPLGRLLDRHRMNLIDTSLS